MSIALTLNEALVQEALDLSQQNDLNFLIETALREYIQRHSMPASLDRSPQPLDARTPGDREA